VRAVASHTASLAGSQAAYRAIFDHYGLIEGRDFDEMLDFAVGFLACGDRLPAGNRMGIVTASGGGGIWTADACAAAGLDVPVLDDPTRCALEEHIPPYGTSENPVDSTAQGVHKMGYAAFARIVAESPLIDGVIVVVTARRSAFLEGDLQKLKDLKSASRKPVFMWTYTLPSERSIEILNEAGYALFTSPLGATRAMRALLDYKNLREKLTARIAPAPLPREAREAGRAMLAASGTTLGEWQARPLLAAYGIGADDGAVLAQSAAEAEAAALALGRPVALKIQSADIPHKTEAGGVVLNVSGADARAAYERVVAAARRHAPKARIDGVLVAPMARPGREVILGIHRDPRWGPLLMVGLGGVLVEAMDDTALAPVPLDHDGALALIGRLKGARLFGAFRGAPASDVDALAATMVKLSQLAADHADAIAGIDLNPVIVHAKGDGVTVVDALILKTGAPQAQGRDAAE
jgi:acyl-CoA synthetase (NDP forming)